MKRLERGHTAKWRERREVNSREIIDDTKVQIQDKQPLRNASTVTSS